MNKIYIKYLKLLPVYVLIQVLILNDILFFDYINPYIYVALIICWPIKNEKWILLLYAFILGFFIDLFSGSLGFHSTAAVFIAFIRNSFIKIIIANNLLTENDEITQAKIGKKSFISFSFLIIFLHHLIIFILEHLKINLEILLKVLLSSIVTLILILILEIIKSSKNE